MPTAKATTKKTAKTTVRKPSRKTAKKTTPDMWFKEFQKGMDELREAHKETEKAHKETEKTLNRAIGGLSNTMGSLVEHIMTNGVPGKFKKFGFTFDRVTTVKWADGENNIYTEIDGLL
jgi:hypothetical protein